VCIQIYVTKVANKYLITSTLHKAMQMFLKNSVVIRNIIEKQLLIQLRKISKLLMQQLEVSFRLCFKYSQKISLDISQ